MNCSVCFILIWGFSAPVLSVESVLLEGFIPGIASGVIIAENTITTVPPKAIARRIAGT